MRRVKQVIGQLVGRLGYSVMKWPTVRYETIPVFHVCVSLLGSRLGRPLRFIQVGANDGRYGDPLHRYIVEQHFTGVLIEPQPDVFQELRKTYAAVADRLVFENVAIAGDRGRVDMFLPPASDGGVSKHAASVVSMNPNVVARQLGVPTSALRRLTVPCMTLDAVTAKHAIETIDILQIDAEGHDEAVLRTLTLSRTAPTIVQFEHGHLTPAQIDTAIGYLAANGYKVLYGGRQGDTVAVHASFEIGP